MTATLCLRNFTAQLLTVKLIERYEAANPTHLPQTTPKHSSLSAGSGFFRYFASFVIHPSSPTPDELSRKAQTFSSQEVQIRLDPFTTHKTEVEATERRPDQILRLTIQEDDTRRWRIDLPTTSSASQKLTPLTSDPGRDYTCIYLPDSSFLAILESTDPQCWMKYLSDQTSVSALSIPGTHNSSTCHKALPSVRCQAVNILEQLNNGIRFFDIRVQPTNPTDSKDETLILVHGAFPISLTGPKKFRTLINEVYDFLNNNPSETIIMSLKREGTGNATDQQLSTILRDHYVANDSSKWYSEPRIPHLGEVRGKIILMRRFVLDDSLKPSHQGRGWCLNAENWAYNTPDCTHGDVRVQDFCEVLETVNIDKKISLCCDHFERAAQVICPMPGITTDSVNPAPAGPLYLTFLSASNFWRVGCWPERIAARLNPAITAFLCEKHDVGDRGVDGPGQEFKGDGGVGIVVCDWVGRDGDWDLVRIILAMNGRLLLRQARG